MIFKQKGFFNLKSLCPATLKSGLPCTNKGNVHFKGYCGVHYKNKFIKIQTKQNNDARLALLLASSSALLTILEKALTHLPDLVEIITSVASDGSLLSPKNSYKEHIDFLSRKYTVSSKKIISDYDNAVHTYQANHTIDNKDLLCSAILDVDALELSEAYKLPSELYEAISFFKKIVLDESGGTAVLIAIHKKSTQGKLPPLGDNDFI